MVPLDGSAFAEEALPAGIAIARRTGALLSLATVRTPTPHWAFAEVPATVPPQESPGGAIEEAYLESTIGRVSQKENLLVNSVILNGSAAPALAEHVAATGVDLVVMTTHGRGGVSRLWLGSVADWLLRSLKVPLLLLRPGQGGRSALPFRKILVPLDGSPRSEEVLDYAAGLGAPEDLQFILLSVVESPVPLADPLTMAPTFPEPFNLEEFRVEAEANLKQVADRLIANGFKAQTKVVVAAPVVPTILKEAAECDLIAMSTHGWGGLQRLVLGSVTDKVVRGSTGPVLAVKPA
jgi:nucleotide-binding universal stress UspA family protein